MESILNQVPPELKDIYRRHWKTIQHSHRVGIIKDVHHYPLVTANNAEIKAKLTETLAHYTRKIKINMAFGFILRKRGTDQLRFFHPSNNTTLFELPKLIVNADDMKRLEKDIEREDGMEYARLQKPSTEWTVEALICVRFDVFKM